MVKKLHWVFLATIFGSSAAMAHTPRYFHCVGQDTNKIKYDLQGVGDETAAVSSVTYSINSIAAPQHAIASSFLSASILAFSLGYDELVGGQVILEAIEQTGRMPAQGPSPQPLTGVSIQNNLHGKLTVLNADGNLKSISVNCVVGI